ncbi:uncharacterized protein LOC113798834 isoform X1 [Dermatophagoides pteronyssinus]|uniref:uncharacterized protein LOC113798834 isoform X1 n=1 Tax=Dermatophagoides pteronyssinus TaxID=6956 RepID=UPI003F67B540
MSSVTVYEQSSSSASTNTMDPIQSIRLSSSSPPSSFKCSSSTSSMTAFSNIVDDDGLTSLSWLQNLNMCMTRLGAPTPPTPPASPICFPLNNTSQTSILNTTCQNGSQQSTTTATTTTQLAKSSPVKLTATTTISGHKSKAIISSPPIQVMSHIVDNNHVKQSDNNDKISFPSNTTNGISSNKVAKLNRTNNQHHSSATEISIVGAKPATTTNMNNKKKLNNRKSITNNHKFSKKNNASSSQNSNHQHQSNTSLNGSCYQHDHHHDNHDECQEESIVVDYKMNGQIKPPYSYATLICMAMKANKNKMTLSSIYKWIKENFLYYQNADPNWQNSIRHNLSLNKCFIKIARNKDEPGKGGFWKLDPIYADSLVDGVFKKRRPTLNSNHNMNNAISKSSNKNAIAQDNGSIVASAKKKRKKRQSSGSAARMNGGGSTTNGHSELFYMDYIEATTSSAAAAANLPSQRQPRIEQETPPNSAESYSQQQHKMMLDMNELNTAIDNIDDRNSVLCSDTNYPSYTFASTVANLVECGNNNSRTNTTATIGFSNEVCVQHVQDMMENDCWNTILTDVDLSELVDPITYTDSVAQIIHPIENDSSLVNCSPNPDANNNNRIISVKNNLPTNGSAQLSELDASHLLDEGHFFYDHRIHGLVFNANVPANVQNQVISANSNVVTCINDTSDLIASDHWDNQWTSYTTNDGSSVQLECDPTASTELILSPLEENEAVKLNEIQVLSTAASAMSKQQSNEANTSVADSSSNSTIMTTVADNFESSTPTNSIQIWECGKALMQVDTNALELFHILDVEQLQQF